MATKTLLEPLRLIQRRRELILQVDIDALPKALRGIYVLYRTISSGNKHPYRNVVYVGMSASGIKGRLRKHRRTKGEEWDCCSVFEVWPNVRVDEIRELEGILRHIFRWDSDAQKLNAQGVYIRLHRTPLLEMKDAYREQKESESSDDADADAETPPAPRKKTASRYTATKNSASKVVTRKVSEGTTAVAAKQSGRRPATKKGKKTGPALSKAA